METYQCKIRFIAPYLQARFSEEAKEGLKESGGKKPQDQNKEEEKRAIEAFSYKDEKGYYVPSEQLKGAIVNGSKQVKRKPRGSFSALAKAILWVKPERIYLNKKKSDYLEISYVKRPDGSRVKVIHPAFNEGLQIEFQLDNLDEDSLDEKSAKKILEWAGKMYGIGGRHPRFGRFEVVGFKKV